MLTTMQCLQVDYQLRCRAEFAPEFRYIMSLAAETDRWTDKLLFSFGKSRHTMKPEFRYIMPCFADVAKLVVLPVEGKLMRVF